MTDELEVVEEEVIEEEVIEEEVELKTTVTIGEGEYEITPLDANKTAFIANLFGRLLISGRLKLKEFKGLTANDLPLAILAGVDEDMLIQLAAKLIGSDEEFARDNFNLAWVLEALVIQTRVSELDTVIRNFTVLVSQIV